MRLLECVAFGGALGCFGNRSEEECCLANCSQEGGLPPLFKVPRPRFKVMIGCEVSTGSDSDRVYRRMDSTLNLQGRLSSIPHREPWTWTLDVGLCAIQTLLC